MWGTGRDRDDARHGAHPLHVPRQPDGRQAFFDRRCSAKVSRAYPLRCDRPVPAGRGPDIDPERSPEAGGDRLTRELLQHPSRRCSRSSIGAVRVREKSQFLATEASTFGPIVGFVFVKYSGAAQAQGRQSRVPLLWLRLRFSRVAKMPGKTWERLFDEVRWKRMFPDQLERRFPSCRSSTRPMVYASPAARRTHWDWMRSMRTGSRA